MYGTQNYDPEIRKEYLIHDTPIPNSIDINTTIIRLEGNNFLLWLWV